MEDHFAIELSKFADEVHGLTEEDFMAKYPLPCLVIDFTTDMINAKMYDTKSGRRHPPTLVGLPEDSNQAAGGGPKYLQFLKKSDRNSFAQKLTVGRSVNNDLFIPHLTISKFHAFFIDSGNPTPPLRDVGSTNGTFLEGKRLVGNQDYATTSGAQIQFGAVTAYLFSPTDLLDYLEVYKRMQT